MTTINEYKILDTYSPQNKIRLSEIVLDLYSSNSKLMILGGYSKIDYGNPVNANTNVIETSNLSNVIDYNPSDLTITVEAGMKMADLTKILKQNNQFLGYKLPQLKNSTVGGAISYGYSGNYRFNDIHIRDSIIGIEAVNQEGKFIKSGGQVVKNVSGYDMHKLFIGTNGSFGPLYSVSFKVYPTPSKEILLAFEYTDLDEAIRIAQKYVFFNWNIPRLSLYKSSKENHYKLVFNIVGTNQIVDKIDKMIHKDSINKSNSESVDESYINNFGYDIGTDEIYIRFTSHKNDFFKSLAELMELRNIQYKLMINPIFGFSSIIIYDDEKSVDNIKKLRQISDDNNVKLFIERGSLKLKNKFNYKNNDNNLSNLTKLFKNTYDKKHLFSPGKLYDS